MSRAARREDGDCPEYTVQEFSAGALVSSKAPLLIRGRQVISLAVASDGSVAAGTVDGSVMLDTEGTGWVQTWYTRPHDKPHTDIQEGSETWIRDAKPNADGSARYATTALAFGPDGRHLVVAQADKSVWLFPIKRGLGRPLREGTTFPSASLAVSESGERLAAISGSNAVFFSIHGDELLRGLALKEPGQIQALVFNSDDTATTSVATDTHGTPQGKETRLELITHNLEIETHARVICQNQPFWSKLPDSCKNLVK